MTTIAVQKVYQLATIPPEPHQRMFLPVLTTGMRLWCHGNRRSSLGGYIGEFSEVWEHNGYVGPKSQRFNLLMEYVNPVTG